MILRFPDLNRGKNIICFEIMRYAVNKVIGILHLSVI